MPWLDADEQPLEGATGDAFLQGILLSEMSAPCHAAATRRRLVLFHEPVAGRRSKVQERTITLEVPWAKVCAYWTGVVPFPPDLWREGPDGEAIVFSLDPAVADGRDIVVWPCTEAWISAARTMGVPELKD